MAKYNGHQRFLNNFSCNERGTLLILAYLVIVILLFAGAALVVVGFNDNFVAERQKRALQAFFIAQAGMNRALNDLYNDYVSSTSWSDGTIGGLSVGPNTASFYSYPCASTTVDNGSYVITLKNVTGASDQAWVKSVGTVGDVSQTIQVYAKITSVSPWNNAIFAGSGASGQAINGNVDVHGPVHILGNGLQSTDVAMAMSGSAKISNNYSGLSATLSAKVPAIATTTFGGETVSSLNAVVRIKKGLASLGGSATMGQTNVTGNALKETIDAVYSTNGFSSGTSSIHSDNGYSNAYDMGNSVTFPSLSSPYNGYASYSAYLKANALVISDAATLTKLASITPNSNFSASNANGSMSMDGNGNMAISGIVYIDGGDLIMNEAGSKKIINYTGKGSIYVSGNVTIDTNLYTTGNSSYPTNVMAVMTPNNITFNQASIDVMGLFYGETQITVQKQTVITGSLVTNYFDLGANVPSIYYVPSVMNNLPTGLIGTSSLWQLNAVAWQEL